MLDLDFNDHTDPVNVIGYLPASIECSDSDSDTDPFADLNRRRPHANLGTDQTVHHLNHKLAFLRPDESSTDDSEASNDDDPDDLRVECRHLALHYCISSLNNPKFHPTRDSLSNLRRMPVDELERVRNELHKISRAVHIVCADDFGVFLRQCFNDMLTSPAALSEKSGLRAIRGFYISTGNHGLGMRLACWRRQTQGPMEYEVSVYDPNNTNQQVQCFVNDLCDLINKPRSFSLLSFLLPKGEEFKRWQESKSKYFEPQYNTVQQVKLYEVDIATQETLTPPIRTDWSASHRTSVYQFHSISEAAHLNALNSTLAQAIRTQNAEPLLELNGFDDAVLVHLLRSSHEAGLAQWRELWQSKACAMQVALLSARTFCGQPWGFLGKKVQPHLLAQWVDMLNSLSPQMAIEVMGATDDQGRVALGMALYVSTQVLQAIDPVLHRCAKTHGRDVARLLTHDDRLGLSPLAYRLTPPQEALSIWLGWLREWVPAKERATALRAANEYRCPALTWAMTSNALAWIDTWGAAVVDMPIEDQVMLLRAWDDDEQTALLHAIRSGNAAAVQAWGRWAIRLPQKERAEVLSGRHPEGWALLTEPWCEQHTQRPNDPSQDLRPTEKVRAQHEALTAWFELLKTLDVPARIKIMAGSDPNGLPAWLSMACDGLVQEVLLLAQALEKLIPPEHRTAMMASLGFEDTLNQDNFLDKLTGKQALHRDIATALTHMRNWVPSDLTAALNQAMGSH